MYCNVISNVVTNHHRLSRQLIEIVTSQKAGQRVVFGGKLIRYFLKQPLKHQEASQ
jgi:hypothetical protein